MAYAFALHDRKSHGFDRPDDRSGDWKGRTEITFEIYDHQRRDRRIRREAPREDPEEAVGLKKKAPGTERSSWGKTALKYLLGRPGWYRVKTAPPVASGTPDVLACYRGRFIGIELKSKGKDATKLQKYRLQEIRDAGGLAFVIDTLAGFRETIKDIEDADPIDHRTS